MFSRKTSNRRGSPDGNGTNSGKGRGKTVIKKKVGKKKLGRIRKTNTTNNENSCSLSLVIIYGIVGSMLLYVSVMVSLTESLSSSYEVPGGMVNNLQQQLQPQQPNVVKEDDQPIRGQDVKPPLHQTSQKEKNPDYQPKQLDTKLKEKPEPAKVKLKPGEKQAWGHGVKPQLLRKANDAQSDAVDNPSDNDRELDSDRPVLTAFMEPIDRSTWKNIPLPVRTTTQDDLQSVEFPQLKSCKRLTEQWPIDNYPEDDPFLPWIHDVFPTHDGTHIQFIAQNKRRCKTGTTSEDIQALNHTEPQVALFQHVAVQRLDNDEGSGEGEGDDQPRYRLVDHSEADEDAMDTRFICRFQPSGEETLSVYNFNYEWASFRKRQRTLFSETGRDNKLIHTSQLTFLCPVPPTLVETVRTGASVKDDYATLFVDLIPIRTPPRYGSPTAFLPPYYEEFRAKHDAFFNATEAWGTKHIVPKVEDSGRWANIPICKPSLLTYGKQAKDEDALAPVPAEGSEAAPVKQHHLVSCLWASTGYTTRGNRFAINDGQRRLMEFIAYNKLIGVDHFYLYDNSGAFSDDPDSSLHPIAQLFPDDVTIIDWPAKVCNNNPNNVDSVGERSSQYAAEASCRLRFGPHVNWIAQFDIDEYLVPMGNLSSVLPLLEKLDAEGNKIISFGSWRAWPRRRFIETPVVMQGRQDCGRDKECFQLRIPMNYTMLQSYNCDRQKPGEKKEQMPAEKQIYRPDYVKHHFIHYSTVTGMSVLNRQDVIKQGKTWIPGSAFPDPLSRFGNEVTEALMLHTKAVATQDTIDWKMACDPTYVGRALCRLGSPFREGMTEEEISKGDDGWKYNCYVNHKIDDFWVPKLEKSLKDHIPELAERMEKEQS